MKENIHKHSITYCLLFISFVAGITLLRYLYFEKLSEPQMQAARKWVLTLLVFLVTEFFGVLGIGFKHQIMNFYHKGIIQGRKGIPCESLDFVEATHKNIVYPLMYCRMEISGYMDIERLKNAITLSCKYVPEILCSFDFRHNQFVDAGHTSESTIIIKSKASTIPPQWDLSHRPQLQVIVNEAKTELEFSMSHILADGKGFMQYLHLLAALYNAPHRSLTEENHRTVLVKVKKIRVGRATEQMKKNKGCKVLPLFLYGYSY